MIEHTVIEYDNDSHADNDYNNGTYYDDGRDDYDYATNDTVVACFVLFDLDCWLLLFIRLR